jgi:hypothetical protein
MTARIDTYTKTVLTIIAACLLWMCVNSTAQPLHAQRTAEQYLPLPATPVVVVGWGRLNPSAPGGVELAWADRDRRISEASMPVHADADRKFEPLRVRVESPAPLPVSLEAVKKSGSWDTLRTAPEPDAGSPAPGIRR